MKGSWRERRPGTWEISAWVRDPETGRRRQITRTVHGKADRRDRELRRLVDEIESGEVQYAQRAATVKGLLEAWIGRRTPEWAPKTRQAAEGVVKRNLGDLAGRDPEQLTTAEVEAHLRAVARGTGKATARAVYRNLSAAFADAYRLDLIGRNPMVKVRAPKAEQREATTVTVDQLRVAVEKAADDPTMAAAVRLAALTGCRAGELCGLQWGDLDGAELRVVRSVDITAGAPRVKDTKTGRGKVISLDAATVAALEQLRTAQEGAAGGRWSSSWFVLSGEQPARPDVLSARWRRLRKTAGLDGVRLHDLRHASATTMIAAGVDPVTAAARLGHSSPTVTLSVYAGAVRERDRAAAEVLARALDG